MATYDPHKLIEQVRELVQASGAEIQPTDEREALIGASQDLPGPALSRAGRRALADRLHGGL